MVTPSSLALAFFDDVSILHHARCQVPRTAVRPSYIFFISTKLARTSYQNQTIFLCLPLIPMFLSPLLKITDVLRQNQNAFSFRSLFPIDFLWY